MHAVRINGEALRFRSIRYIQIGLDHIQASGLSSARASIHKNRHVGAIKQRVRQVETSDPEIHSLHTLRQLAGAQSPHHFDAKSVVTEKNISNAGDENRWH